MLPVMTSMTMTYEDFVAWAKQQPPGTQARIVLGGEQYHTGYLSLQHWCGPDGSYTDVSVRDSKRKRGQYIRVRERHIVGGAFQVKRGHRYVPLEHAS
jgi:hypothetical protein